MAVLVRKSRISVSCDTYLQRRDQVRSLKKGQFADLVDNAGDFGVAGCRSSIGGLPPPRLEALCGDAS